jgi:hypothetical protein
VTQMATRVGTSAAPTGVVTVADLLTRYAPDPLVEAEPATAPVSVGSLLRREGRAPHAQDRPLAPRSRTASEDVDDDGPRRGSGAFVRRSAIAAGTLLAAGSVFGATVVMDSSSTGAADGGQESGGYAGEGRLDLPQGQDRAIPTVVDTAAQTDALDAGDDLPMSWLDVAFPRSSGDAAAAPGTFRAPPAGTPSTDAPAATPVDQGGSSDDGDTGDGPGSGTGGGNPGGGNPGGDQDDDGGTGVGSVVQDLGDGVGGPVGGVVEDLGGVVSGAGKALAGDEPSIVGGLAGGLLR